MLDLNICDDSFFCYFFSTNGILVRFNCVHLFQLSHTFSHQRGGFGLRVIDQWLNVISANLSTQSIITMKYAQQGKIFSAVYFNTGRKQKWNRNNKHSAKMLRVTLHLREKDFRYLGGTSREN